MGLKQNKTLWLGLGVFFLGLFVRVIGIGWGLPDEHRYQSLHPDEPVILGYAQQVEPSKFDFAPGFYNYGTLYLTLVRVTTDVVGAYGGGPSAESEEAVALAVRRIHLAGRIISAIAGAATAWVVLLVLMPRCGQVGAIVGGLAMAFAPGHVVHSRFQTVDVLATLFLALSLHYALKLTPSDGLTSRAIVRIAVLSGVFAGLSAGTKYTGILALTSLLVVCALERKAVGWKPAALGIGAALVAFVVTTPGALVDSAAFLRDFKYEMTHTQTGHGLVFAGTPSGFVMHLWNLFIALGTVTTFVGLIGLARAGWKRHAWALAIIAFALAYYVLIGRAEVKFMRYVFPLVPVLAIGFGWIVGRAKEHPKLGVQLSVGFAAALALATALSSVSRYTTWMVEKDPRDVVADDLHQDVTVGLVADPWFYSPSFYPQIAAGPYVERTPGAFEVRREWMDACKTPRVVRFVPDGTEQRIDLDARLLTELKPDYVVLSSFEIGDLNRLKGLPSPPKEYATQLERAEEFMDTLQTQYEKWKVRGPGANSLPHDMMYVCPLIEVWKRKTDLSSPSSGSSTTSVPNGEQAPTP